MAWGAVETLTICDDKSVHGSEAKSVMISVHEVRDFMMKYE